METNTAMCAICSFPVHYLNIQIFLLRHHEINKLFDVFGGGHFAYCQFHPTTIINSWLAVFRMWEEQDLVVQNSYLEKSQVMDAKLFKVLIYF